MEMEPDFDNMTINEYLEYEAEMERRLRNVQSKRSPTKYEEADFDSFHKNKSNTVNYLYSHGLPPPHPCFLPVQPYLEDCLVSTNVSDDVDIESMTIAEYNMYDITVEDVERIRQLLIPNLPDVMDDVIQPSISKTIHTTPPDRDYVAPATKSILDELLEEFSDEILNVTMVDKEDDFNPTKDIKELERLLANNPQSHFTKIQVHLVIIKPEPFIHTQPMNPLYGVFITSKSSTKPYKVDRDITFPEWIPQQGNGIRGHIDSYSCGKNVVVLAWMLLEEADLEYGLKPDVSSSY
ncbi:hypothetical protein Tco_1165159 [Tanacetum coccineum]